SSWSSPRGGLAGASGSGDCGGESEEREQWRVVSARTRQAHAEEERRFAFMRRSVPQFGGNSRTAIGEGHRPKSGSELLPTDTPSLRFLGIGEAGGSAEVRGAEGLAAAGEGAERFEAEALRRLRLALEALRLDFLDPREALGAGSRASSGGSSAAASWVSATPASTSVAPSGSTSPAGSSGAAGDSVGSSAAGTAV